MAKDPQSCAGCGDSFEPSSKRQRFCSPECRTNTKKDAKAKKAAEEDAETKVIRWATTYGAPIRMLEGWDPATGEWDPESPVGRMIDDITRGSHVTVAARSYGITNITDLTFDGSEYAKISQDRQRIPTEHRVFVDLWNQVEMAETVAEINLSNSVYEKALLDGKLGLDFLSRRWPHRWKEQQAIGSIDQDDERELAVSRLVSNPQTAMQLAAMADAVENEVEDAERQST